MPRCTKMYEGRIQIVNLDCDFDRIIRQKKLRDGLHIVKEEMVP